MKAKFDIDLSSKNDCGFYRLNDFVEIVVNNKLKFNRNFKDSYPVESLQSILNYKISRNAPKDQVDVINIQNYLSNLEK